MFAAIARLYSNSIKNKRYHHVIVGKFPINCTVCAWQIIRNDVRQIMCYLWIIGGDLQLFILRRNFQTIVCIHMTVIAKRIPVDHSCALKGA